MTQHDNFRLSVVIPAYNCAKHIDATINSILKQTHQPYEIIVVNDGSTDNTVEIVSKYPQIRLINKTNTGPSDTRNCGIIESKGNWIAFLDSDDMWHSEKIERVENYITAHPKTDMISTAFSIGNEKGWQKITPRVLYNPNDNFFIQLYRRNFIATSSVVIRKDFLTKTGGFNTELHVAEDLDLYLRIALMNANYHYIKEHLLYYRAHFGSITSNPLKGHQDIEKVFQKFCYQSGLKLFIKRMLIWRATTILALFRQKRIGATCFFIAKMALDLPKCVFVFFAQKDTQTYSVRTIISK